MSEQPLQTSIPSPCRRRCCLDEKDVCVGCFRTHQEILAWNQADDVKRLAILQQCEHRKQNRKRSFS